MDEQKLPDELKEFSEFISEHLKSLPVKRRGFKELEDYPLVIGKECIYVMDWKKSQITYQRGVKEMIGYEPDEFTMELALNYFHPDDTNFVNRIIKGIVTHSIQIKVNQDDHYLNLTFRLRQKDGAYIKVLRKTSCYEVDKYDRLISNFSCLTDINFIGNNDKVEWDLFVNKLDLEGFKKNVHKEFVGFFTKKEVKIINLLSQGLTSKEIGEKEFISPKTVATHRKNILRKSRCHNLRELTEFCEKNGIQ